jgi:hypothetical protein
MRVMGCRFSGAAVCNFLNSCIYLELLNTAGEVMLAQPLFMQTKEQQIALNTETK